MLARRVIAISPDKAVGKVLSAGLQAAGGTVETYSDLDALPSGEIQAPLIAVHAVGDDGLAVAEATAERLRDDASLLLVLDKSDLPATVAGMQKSHRVAGVLVSDTMTVSDVAAIATRALFGDIFGLEKHVPWGTRVYSMLVGDYQEKSVCISQVSEFAQSIGVRRKYRESIEQCLDEMLMNALYDAPVDQSGNQLFADVPTKTRISLRMEQKAVVQYSCDGSTFAISVRDSFGTLERNTVFEYLHKCLYAEQQIDRKAGGAGLGLYIMANATTRFHFNVLPGVATECVCTFDLSAPKVQLKQMGFFSERIDPSGRLVGGASQLVGSGPGFPVERRADGGGSSRGVIAALVAAIALLLALIGMQVYPQMSEPETSSVEIHTTPDDAIVEVDGRVRGTAAAGLLTLDDLKVGQAVKVVVRRDGYASKETVVQPIAGEPAKVDLTLEPEDSEVFLDSDPPGADVVYEGRRLGTTPMTATDLPSGERVSLTFRKSGYSDVTRSVRVPRPGGEASVSTGLTMASDFGSVSITSVPPGATVEQNGVLIAGVTTPVAEHIVEAGKAYRFTVKLPGYQPATIEAAIEPGQRGVPLAATLEAGGGLTVRANIDGRVFVKGAPACSKRELPLLDCPLANGEYELRVEGAGVYANKDLTAVIDGNEVRHELRFGVVEARPGYTIQVRRNRTADRAAFEEGTRRVTVVGEDGDKKQVSVRIDAARPAKVP